MGNIRRLGSLVDICGNFFIPYNISNIRIRPSLFCRLGFTKTWLCGFDYEKQNFRGIINIGRCSMISDTDKFWLQFGSKDDAIKFKQELYDEISNATKNID